MTSLVGGVYYMVFNAIFNIVSVISQLYRTSQCTYQCFPGALFTRTVYNIIPKPLLAFSNTHCENNRWPSMTILKNVCLYYLNFNWDKEVWPKKPGVTNKPIDEKGINKNCYQF